MSIRKKLQKIADEQFEQENIENEKKLKNGEAQILLNNVLNSANSMIEQLKLFVESVNELNKNNTDVYNELKKMVKLPMILSFLFKGLSIIILPSLSIYS